MTSCPPSQCSSPDSSCTMHGVFVNITAAFGNHVGVLITGASGIGKSELALSLIDRGHALIADDSVVFSCIDNPDFIIGSCPAVLQDFLEVRGLGILNIRALFGEQAIKTQQVLTLIIHLITGTPQELHYIDRLHGSESMQSILGQIIPEISLPVFPGRNLAILLECAVKNYLLKKEGYQAVAQFCSQQSQLIKSAATNLKEESETYGS